MSELPESWSISTIGSVSAISTGTTPPTKDITNYGGDIPFVKPGDLDARDAISITEPQLSDIGAARARIVRKGAVLVSCIGNLGKVGVAGRPLATNQQINTVEFNESVVIDRFGYHYCKTLKPWLEHESSATTISIINKSKFSEAPIVIPPLPEQKRIADKLDTLLARIDTCRDRLDRLPTIIKQFRQSVLAAATSGRLTEEWRHKNNVSIEDWENKTVGDIITGINAGINVKCEERPPRLGEKGLVKISAVTWGIFNDNESKTLPTKLEIPESKRIHVGDFLITRANTIELVGACVLVHEVNRPVYLSDKVLRLMMPDSYKKWLLFWLRSLEGRGQIEQLASGNQLSMRNLSQVNLRQINVRLPTESERIEIDRRVEHLFTIADRLETRVKTARARVDTLTPSTLAKAFRGELVPQNPNDEPASVLLDRIRAEKSATPETKSKSKKRRSVIKIGSAEKA